MNITIQTKDGPGSNFTILLAMKLTLLFTAVFILQAAASVRAQQYSLSFRNASLEKIIGELRKQSGLNFLIDSEALKNAPKLSVDVRQASLEEALQAVFRPSNLNYTISEKSISITPKKSMPGQPGHIPYVLAQAEVRGKVVDSLSNPLSGASIRVLNAEGKRTTLQTQADRRGEFLLRNVPEDATLEISYVGHIMQTVGASADVGTIVLLEVPSELEEVEVMVSTGYYQLSQERATGSFVHIDNELLSRRVSTNIIDRLEDVTSGLIFNRTGDSGRDPISIRGRSTLGRFNQPLIVIDNFPFDGSMDDINPNDVESITVLRDAAAASIWGARAGNGVIVITTKSGKAYQPLRVDLTANLNWIESQDAFRDPQMSVSDYIGVERQLFENGYYSATENSPNNLALTPVIENLILARDGVISSQQADANIAKLAQNDFRNDLNSYVNRPQLNQQYNVGLSGGSAIHSYRMSLGYDRLGLAIKGNNARRFTLNLKNDFALLQNKLKVSTSFYGVRNQSLDQNFTTQNLRVNSTTPLYPYALLADENGDPVEVTNELRESFKRAAENDGLLDWAYRPLEEFGRGTTKSQSNDYRLNLGASYTLLKGLNLSAKYQYWEKSSLSENLNSLESYETRNLINLYTQVDALGGLSFPIPRTGILNVGQSYASSHSARAQLDYSHEYENKLRWDVLAGGEMKSLVSRNFSDRHYGYNPELASSQTVDHFTQFARYSNPRSTVSIPDVNSQGLLTDRFLSAFANSSLTFKNKYLLTASVRRDASNLFGVNSNMRSVPLWSAGVGWTFSEEGFYHWEGMPFLKFRFSYGYNGNVDRSLTAFTTAQVITFNTLTQVNYAQIINPPNANLRWERIKIANLGLDFESKSGLISGTIEVYTKSGLDLIGSSPYAPSTGITTFSGNTASTNSKGYDINLTTKNLSGEFSWTSTFLISGIREKVTEYELEVPVSNLINYGISGRGGDYYPIKGKPLFGVYSYPWGGLNPETGAPIGFLDGTPSEDYRTIINSANLDNVRYHGSARPTSYGAIRNMFSWNDFSLSVNISYRFGYYFRKKSVQYQPILQAKGGHADFGLRWQESGDELRTNVPSMPTTQNSFRDQFYRSASVLVEQGDHIRLQDINLSYRFDNSRGFLSGFRNTKLFLYANNLGMIWKATDSGLDPDFAFAKPLRSVAAGFQFDF